MDVYVADQPSEAIAHLKVTFRGLMALFGIIHHGMEGIRMVQVQMHNWYASGITLGIVDLWTIGSWEKPGLTFNRSSLSGPQIAMAMESSTTDRY